MTSRGCIGLVIGAVALVVSCTRPRVTPTASAPSPGHIIRSMVQAYGNAASYEDRGVVTTKFTCDGGRCHRPHCATKRVGF
jgi:hypothetical protein